MNRLTHERNNGIKRGYWSPEKKEELVQRLAAYENTGLEPEEIAELAAAEQARKEAATIEKKKRDEDMLAQMRYMVKYS